MQYVILPEEKTRRASFYLAMEEHVARRLPAGDYLFCWQIEPSVVFGRNQVMANEVDTAYCRNNGIGMFRRKSGGGCIYADMGNVMFSFITDSDNVGLTFNRYINMMVLMLCKIGVNAAATGRNDIVVDGRKVSGNAFYHLQGRSIVHGTMLYDTDMDNMLHAITPPETKLESKGVESVRQRIALLKDYINIGVDGLKDGIMRGLCNSEHVLTAVDVAEIEELERNVYLSPAFIQGKDPMHTIVRRRRIDGVGCVEAHIEVKGGTVKNISLTGDFFATGNVEAITGRLKGVSLDRKALDAALPRKLDGIIMNMHRDDLVALLAGEK